MSYRRGSRSRLLRQLSLPCRSALVTDVHWTHIRRVGIVTPVKTTRIAAIQMNSLLGKKAENLAAIERYAREAARGSPNYPLRNRRPELYGELVRPISCP